MSATIWVAVAAFVVVDLVVMALVFRRLRPLLALARLPDASRRKALVAATEALVGDHLHSGGSEDPAYLGGVVGALLPRMHALWRSYGIDLQPDEVRLIVENAAVHRRVASRKAMRAALATVS